MWQKNYAYEDIPQAIEALPELRRELERHPVSKDALLQIFVAGYGWQEATELLDSLDRELPGLKRTGCSEYISGDMEHPCGVKLNLLGTEEAEILVVELPCTPGGEEGAASQLKELLDRQEHVRGLELFPVNPALAVTRFMDRVIEGREELPVFGAMANTIGQSLRGEAQEKGHAMGGFGGSNKNIGIGCADGKIGKKMIHAGDSGSKWGVNNEEFMERMTESTQATVSHFKDKIAFINVMRNMSVDCDCAGTSAQPVVTPDIGMVASLDILAADQACVDCVYALPEESKHDLVERMESRHSMRQLTYMKEMGMGNDRYQLVDIDNGDKIITAAEAVKGVKGTWVPDGN